MKKPVSRWIAEVQHDENGDAMVIFPPEFCEQTDQREGDLYDINVVDGQIVMTFIKHADAILQYPSEIPSFFDTQIIPSVRVYKRCCFR